MPRSRCQLRVRDPQIFLLLPLLARPHRHAPILQTKPVDTSTLSAHESELAPRAVRNEVIEGLPLTNATKRAVKVIVSGKDTFNLALQLCQRHCLIVVAVLAIDALYAYPAVQGGRRMSTIPRNTICNLHHCDW